MNEEKELESVVKELENIVDNTIRRAETVDSVIRWMLATLIAISIVFFVGSVVIYKFCDLETVANHCHRIDTDE